MQKYKLGLLVLMLGSLGLLFYTLSLSGDAKADKETSTAVYQVSDKLNEYVRTKSKIPESLKEAGAENVPSTIVYTKLSEEKYKVCVTYKSGESYSAGLSGLVFGAIYGASLNSAYKESSSTEQTTYYPPLAQKGEQCTTVKPILKASSSVDTSSSSLNSTLDSYYKDYCTPGGQYYDPEYAQYCDLAQ